jgi:hypothetical protein
VGQRWGDTAAGGRSAERHLLVVLYYYHYAQGSSNSEHKIWRFTARRYNPPAEDKLLGVYPGRFACGLTGVLMTDPVRTGSGIAFERETIERWLESFRRR